MNGNANPQQKEYLHLSVVKKILELMTAAFSFVAALAWNDAIQSLFAKIFGPAAGLAAKFVYALAVTAIVVLVALKLGRLTKKLDKNQTSA